MVRWLEQQGKGAAQINFKLRDWLFARQRYWGEPFPIVYAEGSDVRCQSFQFPPETSSVLPLLDAVYLQRKRQPFAHNDACLGLQEPEGISEEDLPLTLPETDNFRPSGTPESPLANITEWVHFVDPKTGVPAQCLG